MANNEDVPKYEDTQPHDDVPSYDDTQPVSSTPQTPPETSPELYAQMPAYQSATLGAAQGLTGGFSDELEAALRSGSISNEEYQKNRAAIRDMYKRAEQSHPWIYKGADIAGTVIGPGKFAKGAKALMALGALTGLGQSKADLTKPNEDNLEQAGVDVGVGTGLGLLGAGLGKGVTKLASPATSGKVAESALGFKPSETMVNEFNPVTQRVTPTLDTTGNLGQTALQQGSLPFTGGPSAAFKNTTDAINKNFDNLSGTLNITQQKLNQNNAFRNVVPIGEKINQYTENFLNKAKEKLTPKDFKKLQTSIQEETGFGEEGSDTIKNIINSDGNLQKLTNQKRILYNQALSKRPSIYDPDSTGKMQIANYLKGLASIVRGHTEDLASSVDPQAGKQIASTNQTIGNLIKIQDATLDMVDKQSQKAALGLKDLATAGIATAAGHPGIAIPALVAKAGTEMATGYPIATTGKIATAKALSSVQPLVKKVIDTPAGDLVQKVVKQTPTTFANPFAPEDEQEAPTDKPSMPIQRQGVAQATKMASNLYNATNDSLNDVAQKLKQDPKLSFYGSNLEKALKTNNLQEKNRAIFLIMQNPQSRKLVTPQEK